MSWTPEQVANLAPDASSLKAARGLTAPAKWPLLAQADGALWGECQGSGKSPYRTRIDLRSDEPAFKCSCPSRKFPCKHALALFLLFAERADAFGPAEPPDWVSEWLDTRSERQEKQVAKAEERAAKESADPAAQARRAEKRERRVDDGLDALELWLHDLLRQGLASARERNYRHWEEQAARLVDAQAPGLAARVRRLPQLLHSGQGWEGRLLAALGQLHLILRAYRNLAAQPEGMQAELRELIGWNQAKEPLLAQPGVHDQWHCCGQWVEQGDDNLLIQRIWLHGAHSGHHALLLDFAHPRAATGLTHGWRTGQSYQAELVFYPASAPQRALLKGELTALDAPITPPPHPHLQALFAAFGEALAARPWLDRLPATIAGLTPVPQGDGHLLRDALGQTTPLHPSARVWDLYLLSRGAPLTLFGEWSPAGLLPLAAQCDGITHDLSVR